MSDGENLPQIEITTPVPVTALVHLKSPMTRPSKILASAHFDLSWLPIKTSSSMMGVTGVKLPSLNSSVCSDYPGACIDIRPTINWKKGGLNPECPITAKFQMFNDQTQSIEWLLVISNVGSTCSFRLTHGCLDGHYWLHLFLGFHPEPSDICRCPERHCSEERKGLSLWNPTNARALRSPTWSRISSPGWSVLVE